jgi:hypothetical protein
LLICMGTWFVVAASSCAETADAGSDGRSLGRREEQSATRVRSHVRLNGARQRPCSRQGSSMRLQYGCKVDFRR